MWMNESVLNDLVSHKERLLSPTTGVMIYGISGQLAQKTFEVLGI